MKTYIILIAIMLSFCSYANTSLNKENLNSDTNVFALPKNEKINDSIKKAEKSDKTKKIFKNMWETFNFTVDARVDLRYQNTLDVKDDINFDVNTLKIGFSGEVLPIIRYYIKLRLTQGDGEHRDNTGDIVNSAWIAIDAKDFTFTIGKQDILMGAWEYDKAYADIYMSTLVNEQIDGIGTGLDITYSKWNQSFTLQVLNSSPINFTDTKNSFVWTGNYTGSFLDGMLRPAISFSLVNNAARKGIFFFSTGLRFQKDKFTSELDYYCGNYNLTTNIPNIIDSAITITHFVQDQSVSLNLEYRFNYYLNTVLKATFDTRFDKDFSSQTLHRYGISAAIEYYPIKDLPLNIHLAGFYRKNDFYLENIGLRNVRKDTFSVFLGVRWLFSVK